MWGKDTLQNSGIGDITRVLFVMPDFPIGNMANKKKSGERTR